jgi:TnpA family transposase
MCSQRHVPIFAHHLVGPSLSVVGTAIDIAQLAVDTHGHTDLGMAVSHGTGFDMCPRLKALKDRHLILPRGCEVPEILKSICEANLDFGAPPSVRSS